MCEELVIYCAVLQLWGRSTKNPYTIRMPDTAYQEACELNDEMEGIVKNALTN